MADEKKGLLAVYKRGQGSWTRIGLATVMVIFLLWFLSSLDAAFYPEVTLIKGTETLLYADEGKTVLAEPDLALLEKYGITRVHISVEPQGGEKAAEPDWADMVKIRDMFARGRRVHLFQDVSIETRVTPQIIRELKDNKGLDERISFLDNGELKLGNWQMVEAEFKAGKDVRLDGEVTQKTWWRRPLISAPVIEIEITRGNVVIALLCVLGFAAVFKTTNGIRNSNFLIETESELKKVDWSSKEEVFGSTKVVLLLTAVFIVLMFVFDFFYVGIMALIKKACFPGAA
jgi:preprotein translocase SecE subunit